MLDLCALREGRFGGHVERKILLRGQGPLIYSNKRRINIPPSLPPRRFAQPLFSSRVEPVVILKRSASRLSTMNSCIPDLGPRVCTVVGVRVRPATWSVFFMLRTVLFLTFAALAAAQRVPGRYIVELKTDPAAAITAAKRIHYTAADSDVQTRRVQLNAEHEAMEAKIQVLGGKVTNHYTTLINALAVTLMDQAVNLHRITQAWQALPGGQASAGAGIKIGILDCGVDNTHPAFSSFATPLPSGFPIFAGGLASAAHVNNKVIV